MYSLTQERSWKTRRDAWNCCAKRRQPRKCGRHRAGVDTGRKTRGSRGREPSGVAGSSRGGGGGPTSTIPATGTWDTATLGHCHLGVPALNLRAIRVGRHAIKANVMTKTRVLDGRIESGCAIERRVTNVRVHPLIRTLVRVRLRGLVFQGAVKRANCFARWRDLKGFANRGECVHEIAATSDHG